MRERAAETGGPRFSRAAPFFYGWIVVGLAFLATLVAAGIRSAPSVLIHPLEAEFGWSRTAVASAASLNLLIYGVAAPAGGWLIDRIGPRRVILVSLALIALGVTGVVFSGELWQFILIWGVVLGIAIGVTPSLGPSVATRWFVSKRGLSLGILSNANAAGQAVFLPLLMAVILYSGWRSALMVMAVASIVLIPAVLLWMRDGPADIGIQPYGSAKSSAPGQRRAAYGSRDFHLIPDSSFSEVFRSSTFWLLSACFFVCGLTANGLIGTHLIPHAIERGIPEVTAAAAVGIMGGASFVGTTFAGWMVDRVDARRVLSAAYLFRGLSLFILPYISESWGLFVFAVIYGLDWFATGPPTTMLLARTFGPQRVGMLFGFVFVFHQLGGALAALGGGWMRVEFGDYEYAFLTGAVLGVAAAGLALVIRATGPKAPAIPATGELANA